MRVCGGGNFGGGEESGWWRTGEVLVRSGRGLGGFRCGVVRRWCCGQEQGLLAEAEAAAAAGQSSRFFCCWRRGDDCPGVFWRGFG